MNSQTSARILLSVFVFSMLCGGIYFIVSDVSPVGGWIFTILGLVALVLVWMPRKPAKAGR